MQLVSFSCVHPLDMVVIDWQLRERKSKGLAVVFLQKHQDRLEWVRFGLVTRSWKGAHTILSFVFVPHLDRKCLFIFIGCDVYF